MTVTQNFYGDVRVQGDVSARALSIARMIDRLGPGTHRLEITKDEFPGSPWELTHSEVRLVTKVTKSMQDVPK